MGSNAAENHPISMRWVMKSKENGATVISVDPRFTRTSAVADIYAALRSGTDIAFLGGMINYILEKNKYFKDYVDNYTNASYIVEERRERESQGGGRTFQNPKCVLQLLKKHYSRYTPEKVSEITGTPVEDLLKVYEAYSSTGVRDKAGSVLYALGWTHHTFGTQIIRTSAIIQLLLGNIGIAGGGINALRGQPNVQGSTDGALLFHLIPGYLKVPRGAQPTLDQYLKDNTPKTAEAQSVNWWTNTPKYTVSLLKSFYGDKAAKENDYGHTWLPKQTTEYLFLADMRCHTRARQGKFLWSQTPRVAIPTLTRP
jgi:formate dehydrogenase major subunit